jgi:two-component system chemotaxis response regulator CheB
MALRKLRVLVIDDSALNRRLLSDLLANDPEVEVIATAADGEDGLKIALAQRPDAIALDLQMPRVDGFTFLRLLMAKRPTPVVVFSSYARKADAFRALELGAIDFVARPSRPLAPNDPVVAELLQKLKGVRLLSAGALRAGRTATGEMMLARRPERVVVIGASTGGPPAVGRLLARLPADLPMAVLVAQHMPEKFTKAFAERLNRGSSFEVEEAQDGDEVRAGRALIAPGGADMTLQRRGQALSVRVVNGGPERKYRPSVDALFESAASATKGSAVGVAGAVLTGMGADGKEGVVALHAAGALTLAESPETAVIWGMPKEAIDTGKVARVLPLDALIEALVRFGREGR